MKQTTEYINGQLKDKYGDAFIPGNNGTLKDDLLFTIIIQLFSPHINDCVISFMQFSTLVHQRGHWQMGLSFDVYQVI